MWQSIIKIKDGVSFILFCCAICAVLFYIMYYFIQKDEMSVVIRCIVSLFAGMGIGFFGSLALVAVWQEFIKKGAEKGN